MSDGTTLLLVDVQEDFLARPGLTPDRETLLASIAGLLAEARRSGWTVVHVHSRVDADLSNAMPHRRDPARAEVVAGTKGAEPPAPAAPTEGEAVLFKRFFSAFDAAGLEDLLRSTGTRRLIVAGVHSHACIRDTVNDAYRRGFDVVLADDATASYDSAHAALTRAWLSGRSTEILATTDLTGASPIAKWAHNDPRDQSHELFAVELTAPRRVRETATALAARQPALASLKLSQRRERLVDWLRALTEKRESFRDLLVWDVAKPVRDAEGEIAYGLALVDNVIRTLADEEVEHGRQVNFRPRGLVGLITPWNNPFAIAIGKIAPALAYGNAVLWKPALAASNISASISDCLVEAELGEWISMVTGASATGDALVGATEVAAISFTGSVAVGRQLIARSAVRPNPPLVQAELGGSNAAIVDSSADLDLAAADLAAAIFSFSGQRCTAIRRIIVTDDVAAPFIDRLRTAVHSLRVGLPEDPGCDVGPLIDRGSQLRILSAVSAAISDGARLVCGGDVPAELPGDGCWLNPTLIDGAPPDHPLNNEEWFGPIASIIHARDFEQAIELHNRSGFGLLGALYSREEARVAKFVERAQAGILSVGQARPPFAAAGPFNGWKSSGFGIPEHGRWNRDFYCQTQAVYRQ